MLSMLSMCCDLALGPANVNCRIARFCYAAGMYRTDLLNVVVRDYVRQLVAP